MSTRFARFMNAIEGAGIRVAHEEPTLAAVTLSYDNAPRDAAEKRSGLGMTRRAITKIGIVALALMLLALIWGFTPISHLANPDAVAAAMMVVSASPWQFAIVLGCFLGAGLVVFPMLLLIIACAAVFGPVLGF